MTDRNGREDSDASDESTDIPVTVEDGPDDEAEADGEVAAESSEVQVEPDGRSPDGDGREEAETDSPREEGGGDPDADELDDLYLDPDESDVEVVDDADVSAEAAEPVEAELVDGEQEAGPAEGGLAEDTSEARARDEGPSREELTEHIEELEAEIESLQDERDELKRERDDFEERMLRAAADLENFRKRSKREKEEIRKYGAKDLVKDLLETIDNLERAVEHSGSGEEENIIEGVEMVLRQIHNALGSHGIEAFVSEGEPFDPEYHEAIQQVETTDHESGTILEQHQKGYTIHDRLLRPALVSVAENIEAGDEDAGDEDAIEDRGDDEEAADGDGTESGADQPADESDNRADASPEDDGDAREGSS